MLIWSFVGGVRYYFAVGELFLATFLLLLAANHVYFHSCHHFELSSNCF